MAFHKTIAALKKLQQILRCSICNEYLKEPVHLSTCEHCFCRDCITPRASFNDSCCPVCRLPLWSKDIHDYHHIRNVISGTESLINMISSSHDQTPLSHDLSHDQAPLSHDHYQSMQSSRDSSSDHNQSSHNSSHDDYQVSHDSSHDHCQSSHDHCQSSHEPSTKRRRVMEVPTKCRRNIRGETPLHIASLKGDINKVQLLLNQGASPNTQDHAGWTPLHEACSNGYKDIVRLLIENGAIVNAIGYHNNTPLHDAVRDNHVDIAKYLMEHGASTTIRNHYGYTAVDLAVSEAMKDCLREVQTIDSNTRRHPVAVTKEERSIVIISSALDQIQKEILTCTVKSLGGSLLERFDKSVTHVVTKCNENRVSPRTIKTMSGVAAGIWVLDYQWVVKCNEENCWVSEEPYEVAGLHSEEMIISGPHKARIVRSIKNPGLFEGIKIHFKGVFVSPSKQELIDLVSLSDGVILSREPKLRSVTMSSSTYPFHAVPDTVFCSHTSIIIHPNTDVYIRNGVLNLPLSWLLDSVAGFTLKLVSFT